MIVVLAPGTTEPEVGEVRAALEAQGLSIQPLKAGPRPLLHVTAGPARLARRVLDHPRVEGLVPTAGPRVRREGRRFYPYHALWIVCAALLVGGLLVVLAGAFPPGIGAAAPIGGGESAVPEWPWYLRPFRGVLAFLPASPGWLGPLVLALLIVLVLALPLLDRSRASHPAQRWPVLAVGAAAAVYALIAVLWGGTP